MKTEYKIVTPALAAEYLKKNKTDNRSIRKNWVKTLADSIKRGEWVTTHQGIAFASDGTLIDGQHRLHAIAEAEVPVVLAVTTGIDASNAYMVIDQGVRKTSADVFHIPTKHMEIIRLASQMVYGTTYTKAQEATLIPALLPLIEKLHAASNTAKRVLSSASVRLAAVINMLEGEDAEYVTSLYSNILALRVETLPPVARSLVLLATVGRRGAVNSQYSNFAIAYKVFQRKNAAITKVYAQNPMTYVDIARKTLRTVITQQ
jgi:hypothetical protein